MPRIYPYDPDAKPPEDDGKPKKACDGSRQDLLHCLLESDCVKINRMSPRDCLRLDRSDPSVPAECRAIALSFFECKRSLLDRRRQFRGPKGY